MNIWFIESRKDSLVKVLEGYGLERWSRAVDIVLRLDIEEYEHPLFESLRFYSLYIIRNIIITGEMRGNQFLTTKHLKIHETKDISKRQISARVSRLMKIFCFEVSSLGNNVVSEF